MKQKRKEALEDPYEKKDYVFTRRKPGSLFEMKKIKKNLVELME